MPTVDTEEFNPLRVLAGIWLHRWRIALFVFTGMMIAALYAFTARPVYRAEALLAPNEDQTSRIGLAQIAGQFGGLASLAGLNMDSGKTEKDVAIALLTGSEFLDHFIAENNLMPKLFADQWDVESNKWRTSWYRHEPTVNDAIKLLRDEIVSVKEDRRTGLVRVAVEWFDRNAAATWANLLVEQVNAVTRAAAIEDARKSQEYLRRERAKADVIELDQAINRMLELQLKNEMAATVRLDYTFRVVDPARTPDVQAFVWPRRGVLLGLGLFVGLGLGVMFALTVNAMPAKRSELLNASR